jgi:hypothetical protein
VSRFFIANLAADLCSPSDDEWVALSKLGPTDTDQMLRIAREKILPEFQRFDEDSRQKIRDSIEYFAGVSESGLERVFSSFQIPLPESTARPFLMIVWQELFKTRFPAAVNKLDFEVDDRPEFANSLRSKAS